MKSKTEEFGVKTFYGPLSQKQSTSKWVGVQEYAKFLQAYVTQSIWPIQEPATNKRIESFLY